MIFQANGELPERVRGLGCRRGNGKAVLYIRGQHPRNGIVLRRDDSRVDAAASAKIPREVKWPVNGQTVSLDTTSLLKHHYVMFAHRLRMMKRMCAFILFILYFQVRFEVFKRNGGNGNKTEGGRDTGTSADMGLGMLSFGKSCYDV